MTARSEVTPLAVGLAGELDCVAAYLERHGDLPTTAVTVRRIARQVATLEATVAPAPADAGAEVELRCPCGEPWEVIDDGVPYCVACWQSVHAAGAVQPQSGRTFVVPAPAGPRPALTPQAGEVGDVQAIDDLLAHCEVRASRTMEPRKSEWLRRAAALRALAAQAGAMAPVMTVSSKAAGAGGGEGPRTLIVGDVERWEAEWVADSITHEWGLTRTERERAAGIVRALAAQAREDSELLDYAQQHLILWRAKLTSDSPITVDARDVEVPDGQDLRAVIRKARDEHRPGLACHCFFDAPAAPPPGSVTIRARAAETGGADA